MPDFDKMTILELLQWEQENKNENIEWQDWMSALEDIYPFEQIFDRLNALDKNLEKLEQKVDRLINALDKTGIEFKTSLRDVVK